MAMLLADLAEEASASIQRAAARLDDEARVLGELRQVKAERGDIGRKAVESARQATDYAVSRLPQVEAVWRSAITILRGTPIDGDAQQQLLRILIEVFEAGERLCKASRELWALAEDLGASSEPIEDLDGARRRFAELAEEARVALEHREKGWQAADPDRLEYGLQLAREGRTIKADQARSRFRRN